MNEKDHTEDKDISYQDRFNDTLELMESASWEYDLLTNKLWRSLKTDQIFGYTDLIPEWTFKLLLDHVVPEDREMVKSTLNKSVIAKSNWSLECRITRNDGCSSWILIKGLFKSEETEELTKIFGIIQDITDRKLHEDEITEAKDKYIALYDNAPLSYQSLNSDGTFRDINPCWLHTLGYKRDEVIGEKYSDFLHPDWKEHFINNFPKFKKRGYVSDVHFKIRHKLGHYIDISFEGCIGYNKDGSVRQTYCVFQDITVRLKAENQLKISEERFRLLYNNFPDMHGS